MLSTPKKAASSELYQKMAKSSLFLLKFFLLATTFMFLLLPELEGAIPKQHEAAPKRQPLESVVSSGEPEVFLRRQRDLAGADEANDGATCIIRVKKVDVEIEEFHLTSFMSRWRKCRANA